MGVSRKPNRRDVEIGHDLARKRKSVGISQATLAAALGISTQQYGKYERGENRISTGRYEQVLEFLHAGTVQPGLAEERAGYLAPDPRWAEFEQSLVALQRAVEDCLAAFRRASEGRNPRI